ncbi:MAG TPA: hypothetical protein VFJ43_04330 [Bacteroidia bacterium]|nr:hypothetical protein [Bacteroidia bacterium]
MNMTRRSTTFIITLIMLFTGLVCHAQKTSKDNKNSSGGRQTTYTTAVGLRGGFEGGLTFKHFLSGSGAFEGILSRGWGWGGFRITGLYEMQKGLPNAKGLDWFWGVGAHIGFYDGAYYGYYGYYGGGYYDKHGYWHPTGYQDHYTAIGIDGILGLEYQFTEVPINLGLDIKPYFDIFGRGYHYLDAAFSIRYVVK